MLPVVLGGRYRLERLIDRGGMGAVYEAVQLDLGRRVAIKVLDAQPKHDPLAEERFAREAQIAARLASPHTVSVTDFVNARGHEPSFLVMELLVGASLHRVLTSEVMLPPERAVAITRQVLHVLGEAHQAGIIHRDIKPGNVFLVTTQLREDFVKVLDFGLARLTEGLSITAGPSRAGTLAYMAPEQANGATLDGRADLYAVSATLYSMLTGRRVVLARSFEELLDELRTKSPPAPSTLAAGLDPELDAIVLRGLAKDREQRFPTAEAFASALDAWAERRHRETAAQDAMSARPPTAPVSTSPWGPGPPLTSVPPTSTDPSVSAAPVTMTRPSTAPLGAIGTMPTPRGHMTPHVPTGWAPPGAPSHPSLPAPAQTSPPGRSRGLFIGLGVGLFALAALGATGFAALHYVKAQTAETDSGIASASVPAVTATPSAPPTEPPVAPSVPAATVKPTAVVTPPPIVKLDAGAAPPSGRVAFVMKRTDSEALPTELLTKKLRPGIDACIQKPESQGRTLIPGKIQLVFGKDAAWNGKLFQINYRRATDMVDEPYMNFLSCLRGTIRGADLGVPTDKVGVVLFQLDPA